MVQAICIAADNDSAAPVRALWKTVGALEAIPSMERLDYPPHITLAVYDGVSGDALSDVTRAVFAGCRALRVTFDGIRSFNGPPMVLWANPANAEALRGLHRAVHERIDPRQCRDHYRPKNWIPHCSLGTAIEGVNRRAAQAVADKSVEPFDVLFDRADCVTFPPVRVLRRINLT